MARTQFTIHSPPRFDRTNPHTVVKPPLVIAWGDFPPADAANKLEYVLGVLYTVEGAPPQIVKGKTLSSDSAGLAFTDLWVVVFNGVTAGNNYIMEIWRTKPDGTRDILLGYRQPIAVQATVDKNITLSGPVQNSQVFLQFMAGGQDSDYIAVTTTFANGMAPGPFNGVEYHRGSPAEPYWLHSFTLPQTAAGTAGYTCSAKNANMMAPVTSTGISVSANPAPAPGPGAGAG